MTDGNLRYHWLKCRHVIDNILSHRPGVLYFHDAADSSAADTLISIMRTFVPVSFHPPCTKNKYWP